MKIEALRPLCIQVSNPDREITLRPGHPIDLPARQVQKVLRNCKGKVRLVVELDSDWLTLWKHVAEISDGLTSADPRRPEVLRAFEICDEAFAMGSKASFWD